jgi:hypothetical protein
MWPSRWLKRKASQRLVVLINLNLNSDLLVALTANMNKENPDHSCAHGQATSAALGLRPDSCLEHRAVV